MGWHEDDPVWSRRVHNLASKLAALDGLDPNAPHTRPDGSTTLCGDLGYFTNTDFYLPEACDVLGPPAVHLEAHRSRVITRRRT